MTRYFYWYKNICLCDLGLRWNWPLSGALCFTNTSCYCFFFLWQDYWYVNMNPSITEILCRVSEILVNVKACGQWQIVLTCTNVREKTSKIILINTFVNEICIRTTVYDLDNIYQLAHKETSLKDYRSLINDTFK